MAIPGPGIPGLSSGRTIRTTTGQRYQVGYRPGGQLRFTREAFNNGGYAGLVPRQGGRPVPVNLLQAYGNMGGQLPGLTYRPGAGGAGQFVSSTPPKPATSPAAPGAQPSTGDPRDATYYQNVAANQFKVNNEINALNLQGQQANTALQAQLAALDYQQPRSQLALEQRANAAGSLYSSAEGQRQGDLVHQFATQRGSDQTAYDNLASKIAGQISGLEQGVPIYNSGQYLAAAIRAAQAAANNPATGQPLSVPVPHPGQARGPEVRNQRYQRVGTRPPESINQRYQKARR